MYKQTKRTITKFIKINGYKTSIENSIACPYTANSPSEISIDKIINKIK